MTCRKTAVGLESMRCTADRRKPACRSSVRPVNRQSQYKRLLYALLHSPAEPRTVMAVLRMPDPPRDLAAVVERRSGLLAVQDLIQLTGFKKTAIYDMVAEGRIPYLRFESSIRFDPIAIAAWLREHTVPLAA